jgi:hypothetical protein
MTQNLERSAVGERGARLRLAPVLAATAYGLNRRLMGELPPDIAYGLLDRVIDAPEQALWLHRDGPDKAVRPCDVDEEVDAQVALHPVGSQLCIRVRRLGMDEEPWNKQVGAGRGSGESGRGET